MNAFDNYVIQSTDKNQFRIINSREVNNNLYINSGSVLKIRVS